MSNVTDFNQYKAARPKRQNTSPRDLEAAVSLEKIVASLNDDYKQKHGWMPEATKAGKVPSQHSTGDAETDTAGIALAVNTAADMCVFDMDVFKTTIEFFNSLLVGLDDAQRERVLSHLDKSAATALLMLDYSEKLKAAELAPMVDKVLRARD